MRKNFLIRQAAVWLAVLGFCLPSAVLAEKPATGRSPLVADVALQEGGALVGQVVDRQGSPLANVPVSLRSAAGELARVRTNSNGYFRFSGLRNGVYEVATPLGANVYRVWSRGVAPPAARPQALIVVGDDVLRGQSCKRLMRACAENPLIPIGLITAAVAIPLCAVGDKGPCS